MRAHRLSPLLLAICLTFSPLSLLTAQLVINEADPDQSGSDSGEFVELYDGGAGNTSLDGHVVVFYNGGNTDASYRAFDLTGETTNAAGFFVLGNPDVPNVDLIFDPGNSGALQNGPDAIALYEGTADDFPNGTPLTDVNLVDALVYGTDDSDDFDLLDTLTPGELQLNDTRTESLSRLPDGGDPFDISTYALQVPTPGFANVITETLELTLESASVTEDAGEVSLTVSRSGPTDAALTISLSSDDFTELNVPNEIILDAGVAEGSVALTILNDSWPDGAQSVNIVAGAQGFMDASIILEVTDDGDPLALVVNEVYANDQLDANGDNEGGDDGPGLDEFVEIVNATNSPFDLTNHTLTDMVAGRHTFPEGTVLDPGCAVVIFGGGGVLEGNNAQFGGSLVQKANGSNQFGLGLNNSGDFVRLLDPDGAEIAGTRFAQAFGDASLARNPDLTGAFVDHFEIESDAGPFSITPGVRADGEPFCAIALNLTLMLSNQFVAENGGENVSTLTIVRSGENAEPLTVSINNGDPSEISLPVSVEIPAGQDSIEVPVDAVDDLAQDGPIIVSISASAPGFVTGEVMIQVDDDNDEPVLVIINELDADQPGDEIGEFIELYDGGTGNLPLDGLIVVLFNGNNGQSYDTIDLSNQSTDENGFFVLGDSELAEADLGIDGFTLQNGPDAVAIYRQHPDAFPNGSFPLEDDLVDAVVYGTNDDDAFDLLDLLTPGNPQVNEGGSNNEASISRSPDGGDAFQTTTFVAVAPTPGGPNGVPPAESYGLWAGQFENLGGPDDDPDQDRLSNVFEYALRTDPLQPNPDRVPQIQATQDGFEVRYQLEGTLPPDVLIGYEASETLEGFMPIEGGALMETIQGNTVTARFERDFSATPRYFVRLAAFLAVP